GRGRAQGDARRLRDPRVGSPARGPLPGRAREGALPVERTPAAVRGPGGFRVAGAGDRFRPQKNLLDDGDSAAGLYRRGRCLMYRLILATAFLFALAITRVVPAADRFVSTAGGDAANDCLSSVSPCRTVARGLAEAASGDTVKVGAGTYHENVSVSTPITLTLSGGWAADFSTQDPVAMPSVLQAAIDLPVVTVVANGIAITFAADGLTVQGGRNAAGLFGT